MKTVSLAMATLVLATAACGRTSLLDPPRPSPRGDAGQEPQRDTSPMVPEAIQDSGADTRREMVVDAPRAVDARVDGTPDAPVGAADLGRDSRIDTPVLDARPDVVVDSGRDANDGGARDGGADTQRDLAVDAGRSFDLASRDVGGDRDTADGGPTLKLIAGSPGGPGHQDGTLVLAKFSFPYGIASDGAGNVFVAQGGGGNAPAIRRIDLGAGMVTTLLGSANSDGPADGTDAAVRLYDITNLVCDGDGNLFFSDSDGHTIGKVVIATGEFTKLAGSSLSPGSQDGTGTAARFNGPSGVASDGAGNLFVADYGNHTIRKIVIATGAVTTLAGMAGINGAQDGLGTAARFAYPWGVAVDGVGHLYVADTANHTVRKIVIASGEVTTLAGSAGIVAHKDGVGTAARFFEARGLAYHDGALYVTEREGNDIRKVVIASGEVTTLAGTPAASGNRDGKSTEAQFNKPHGVTVGKSGDLFVADTFNHAIRKVVASTGEVSLIAGSYAQTGIVDRIGAQARFHAPRGVASDGAGNLYVTDFLNQSIRKVVVGSGLVTTLAGQATQEGNADGSAAPASFSSLAGIALDPTGNLLVSDGHCLRRVVVATGQVSTLAGSCGSADHIDGVGTSARFENPTGIVTDKEGAAFVVDRGNRKIRKLVLATGEVSTLPCWTEASPQVDGGTDAEPFNNPWGIATDGAGNLYVADTLDRTVRKVVIATGKVTVLAGRSGELGYRDGIGDTAYFRYPVDLVSDGAGGLLVADMLNGVIRKIDIATRAVTTVVGDPGQRGLALSPLPPVLNYPGGLALGPAGELFIVDRGQNVVLSWAAP